jgi:hypothetical protein
MKHGIYLRCHTRILDDKSERKRQFSRCSPDPRYVLLFDMETTTDSKLSLNFGAYQFCERDTCGNLCLEEGLFYADDLDSAQTEVIRKYVRNENRKRPGISRPKLKLYSRDAFVEKVFHVAVQAGAAICAYNLPFDLSRIAVEYRVAHGAGKRGWSFVYLDIGIGKKESGFQILFGHASNSVLRIPKQHSSVLPEAIKTNLSAADDFLI